MTYLSIVLFAVLKHLLPLVRPLTIAFVVSFFLCSFSSLPPNLLRGSANPSDMVLLVAFYQVDAFKNIRNIIDSPLLDTQLGHGLVQVKALIVSFHQKLDELFGELN